jgi:site-specific DNA-methyltransferase (adenine-specific)
MDTHKNGHNESSSYSNNKVRLYLGDCLELLDQIEDNSVDMVMCDMPYGTTDCAWDSIIDLDRLWKHYYRVGKENCAFVFTGSQPFTTTLINSNISDFRYELIWEKPQGTNPMSASRMPLKSHENILVFYRRLPTYNPQMEQGSPYKGFQSEKSTIGEVYGSLKSVHRNNPDGTRYPKSVLRFKQEKGLHPTQKPVELMEYLIKTFSNEGDTILDNTMGSGSTGVACINTNRKFIGMEEDKAHFMTAQKRLNDTLIRSEMDIMKLLG